MLPFAVVGSTDEVKVGKRMVRGRHYPWGVLQGKYEQADSWRIKSNTQYISATVSKWHLNFSHCWQLLLTYKLIATNED